MVTIDTTGAIDGAEPAERQIYRVGWFRKAVLSFLILLLLPFYVSLAPMLLARFSHGMPIGTWGLVMIGAATTVVLVLLTFQLVHAVRAKIELGEKAFRTVLPRRALSPTLSFDRREVTYEDVRAVELRREIFGAPLAPVLMQGARVIPREGPPIILGHVNENNVDPVFPIPEIARSIARRSGIQVTDIGTVRRSVPHKMLGLVDPYAKSEPIAAEELAALARRHDRLMIILVLGLVALLGLGIAADVMTENGKPAVSTQPLPQPKPGKR